MNKNGFSKIAVFIIVAIIVTATGWWFFRKPHMNISPANPTATWQTYHNNEAKFEIKYPSNWFLKKDISDQLVMILIASDDREYRVPGETIAVIDLSVVRSERVGVSYFSGSNDDVASTNKFIIDGITGTKNTHKSGDYYSLIVVNKELTYDFYVQPKRFVQGKTTDYSSTVTQILSTFKFIK